MFPLRYLILVWGRRFFSICEIKALNKRNSIWSTKGINKFTKILRKPKGYVDNTEILDFLSRVPSNQEIVQYREAKFVRSSASINSHQNFANTKDNAKKRAQFRADEKKLKTK